MGHDSHFLITVARNSKRFDKDSCNSPVVRNFLLKAAKGVIHLVVVIVVMVRAFLVSGDARVRMVLMLR